MIDIAVRANARGVVRQSRRRSLSFDRTSDWRLQQETNYSKPRIEGDSLIIPIKIEKGVPGTESHSVSYMDYRVPKGER